LELARLRPHARILDIGCGSGHTVGWLRRCCGLDAVGLDVLRPVARSETPLVQAQAEQLPFARGTWDAVLSECCLSVTREPEVVLAECARVLAPGGKLLITDVYARKSESPGALIVRGELVSQLAVHGFHILLWENHSDVLRAFVGRHILEYGSIDGLWAGSCADALAMKQAHPGYFLLIAERSNH
jgi:SAM-dependent methyltransferase